MDSMLRYYERDGFRIMPLSGEFDLGNSDALEALIQAALDGKKPLIVDFSATKYIDSTVLRMLIRQKQRAGAQLQLAVPRTSQLCRIFEITGLHERLCVSSPNEAEFDRPESPRD